MLRHRDAEAAIKVQAHAAVTVLRNALAELGLISDGGK
jgi:hypothetical protein